MAVPDYQSIMLPLLKYVSDQQVHTLRDVVEGLATHFKLTEEERREMLPSGMQAAFDNRVGWARTYLKKAGLLASPKRATMQITQRGIQVIKENPPRIDVAYLKRFQEFVEFQSTKRESNEPEVLMEDSNERTPEEVIENGYEQVRAALSQELLSKVQALTWMDFERLVVQLLVRMGYGGSLKDAGRALTKGGDEGIDGTIKEDKLGLDVIYIQAKKW